MKSHNMKDYTLPDIGLMFFLFFSYIKLHLSIPGIGIPYFFTHLTAIIYLYRHKYLGQTLKNTIPFFIFLFFQFFLTATNSPIPGKIDVQNFIYNSLNIISVFTLFLALRLSDAKHIENFSLLFMLTLIVMGAIESYGNNKEVFDLVRRLYTSDLTIYTAEDRDLLQYGSVRPNVFTSEPSSVGNFFGSLWILYFSLLGQSAKKNFFCAILMILAIFLFRTPTLPIYIIIGIVLSLYKYNEKFIYLSWTIALSTLFILVFLPYYLYNNSLPIVSSIEFVHDFISTGSFYIRQVAPVDNFLYMLNDSKFFGYGYSYAEQMKSNNWADLHDKNPIFYDYSRISEMPGGQFITNALWEFFVLNGLLGSAFVAFYVCILLGKLGGSSFKMLIACAACVWVSHAGVNLIFTWIPVVFIAYILSVRCDLSKLP